MTSAVTTGRADVYDLVRRVLAFGAIGAAANAQAELEAAAELWRSVLELEVRLAVSEMRHRRSALQCHMAMAGRHGSGGRAYASVVTAPVATEAGPCSTGRSRRS
jgi:hypothetical protein